MGLLEEMVTHTKFQNRSSDYIRWYPKSLVRPNFDNLFNDEELNPNGMYIHIPFCDKICSFCPYNKRVTNEKLIHDYVNALIIEINNYSRMITSSNIEFIYFGGGTPSTLKSDQLKRIIENIYARFNVSIDVEITLESHPSHLIISYLKQVKEIGVTRISTGIQAFDDNLLKNLGSKHNSEQAFNAINNTNKVFGNISIDLLFNCPSQDISNWKKQLETTINLPGINHISCYSLILPNDDKQPSKYEEAEMTTFMDRFLRENGFQHYASCASGGFDYSKVGHQCIYEISHWGSPQAQFIGLGAGAMGYVGKTATVNGLSIKNYINRLYKGSMPLVSTSFSNREEYIRRQFVLGVKTLEVDFNTIDITNDEIQDLFKNEFKLLKEWNFAHVSKSNLKLTDLGRMYVDSISELFFSQHEREIQHPEEPEIREIEKKVFNEYDKEELNNIV